MPPAPSGTHTPPRPPAGIRRPLGVLQNAWLEPGRNDRLNRNQLPLNTDTFGRRGGSCSKQTLVITTPCSSPNTRSALSALGPPLVEMKCAIDSPSRCPASRAGLFGAMAQAASAITRQGALRRLASTALATTAPRDARRNPPHLHPHSPPPMSPTAPSAVRPTALHARTTERAARAPRHDRHTTSANHGRETGTPPTRAPLLPSPCLSRLRGPRARTPVPHRTRAGRAHRLCARLRRRPTAAVAKSGEAAVAGFSPPHARFAQPQSGPARQSASCAQAPTAAAAPRRRAAGSRRRRGELLGAAARELDCGAARKRRGAGFHRRGEELDGATVRERVTTRGAVRSAGSAG